MIYKQLKMFADSLVAIDGSRFIAVNNRDRNFTKEKVKRRIAAINESLDQSLDQLESFDRQEQQIPKAKTEHISKQIDSLKRQMKEVQVPISNTSYAPAKAYNRKIRF